MEFYGCLWYNIPEMTEKENGMNQADVIRIAMEQSAVDCSCAPSDFTKSDNVVTESLAADGARKYLKLPHICDLVSYGSNVVACCREDLIPGVRRFVDQLPNPGACFETPAIYALNRVLEKADARVCFMAAYFLPDIEQVFKADLSCAFETRLLHQEDFAELYLPEWSNALCKDRKHLDVLGVGAYDGGKLVGFAACSADGDGMWQIGVDVLPEYRRRGIASALTNRLARAMFEREKVPFYCAAWSNVKSVKNALRSGFRPGWAEITAKSNQFIAETFGKTGDMI